MIIYRHPMNLRFSLILLWFGSFWRQGMYMLFTGHSPNQPAIFFRDWLKIGIPKNVYVIEILQCLYRMGRTVITDWPCNFKQDVPFVCVYYDSTIYVCPQFWLLWNYNYETLYIMFVYLLWLYYDSTMICVLIAAYYETTTMKRSIENIWKGAS